MDSAHDKAILEAWIQEHKGIVDRHGARLGSKWEAPLPWSDIARQFTLVNSSTIIVKHDGLWEHRSHLGFTVKMGSGLRTLIPYLDSMKMPKKDREIDRIVL